MTCFTRPIPQAPNKPDVFERIRVEPMTEPGPDVTVIAEEVVTSHSDRAELLATNDAVWLTPDDVRWLHGVLGELLAMWERGEITGDVAIAEQKP